LAENEKAISINIAKDDLSIWCVFESEI
jgi:hypothetical protein